MQKETDKSNLDSSHGEIGKAISDAVFNIVVYFTWELFVFSKIFKVFFYREIGIDKFEIIFFFQIIWEICYISNSQISNEKRNQMNPNFTKKVMINNF